MSNNQDSSSLNVPKHIAIIMDGNGRWATRRNRPRTFGHKAGVDSLKKTIEGCIKQGVEVLTVFAFSSENWQRPEKEVSMLMSLFLSTLGSQAKSLSRNNIRLKIIGYREGFSKKLQSKISDIEKLTESNSGLTLVIAANYGGQWDVLQAVKILAKKCIADGVSADGVSIDTIDEKMMSQSLSTDGLPNPDLFIRTGGDHRISNFLLWQLAYCELYFTNTLWPDFDEEALANAISDYASRQRRFGRTGEQVQTDLGES